MDFASTTMLITGASQGIGRYLAVHFAEKGADVILTARNEVNLQATAQLVEDAVRRPCPYIVSDLRDTASLEALVKRIEDLDVGVDVLVNNAADVTSRPFLETSMEEIDGLIRTNVIGCLQLTRLLTPAMVERGGGMVINLSSLAGFKTNPGQTVYSISKAAVNGISDALRVELSDQGIHVMNVALSSVGVEEPLRPGQVPVARFAVELERAIHKRQDELYLSPITKWLMRLYRLYPPLARIRKVEPH